jgi:hypothetical protein
MTEPELRAIERLIFATDSPDAIRDWLTKHVSARRGMTIDQITFRAGDIGAVFGLKLADGRNVVLKAARPEADQNRLQLVVSMQNQLVSAEFPCPRVLDGPSTTIGLTAVIEQAVVAKSNGSPHHAGTRMTMARGLAQQIELLRGVNGEALVSGRPAWANWDSGAWPTPHDPIFDFTAAVDGFEWLDTVADNAAHVLRSTELPPVIGHSDWVWQNVCIRDQELLAGYDWDSLIYAPESAITGVVASSFTQGSPVAPDAPSSDEIEAFISDYQKASGRRFNDAEQRTARAAATWVRCYNARCQLDNLNRRNIAPPAGSFLDQLRPEFG